MNLVQDYLALATEIASFNKYDNKTLVKEYNRKISQMRNLASKIEQSNPDLKTEFCNLLSHKNNTIRLWVSHHILEVMTCEKKFRKSALKEIRNIAKTDKTANSLGEKLWLKEWYKTHPEDRWLR
ncbi:MAG: DUF2019 domain-containing protein [Clostridia bacterium]|nr:DUF2019 domain-containing protein [Clostridia bacterium]